MRETREWWNETARYFQPEAEIPVGIHFGSGTPDDDTLGLIEGIEGADVVELGCGGGQCSVAFAERGAASVVGVDLSSAQLDYASDLTDEHGVAVALVEGDVTALPLSDDSADIAFSAYAFQWVPDLETCFAEAHRVLRDGGQFVFSFDHPFYQRLDPETGDIERSYFETGVRPVEHEGVEADERIVFHRVSDVHDALVEAGFTVERLLEPGSSDPEDYEELWEFRPEMMAKVPPTLVVRATA